MSKKIYNIMEKSHRKTKVVPNGTDIYSTRPLSETILEQNFKPYYFTHDEISDVINFVKENHKIYSLMVKRAVKTFEDGSYRAYEIPINYKFNRNGMDRCDYYYIKSGEINFEISLAQYRTVTSKTAVVIVIGKGKHADFYLYGADGGIL